MADLELFPDTVVRVTQGDQDAGRTTTVRAHTRTVTPRHRQDDRETAVEAAVAVARCASAVESEIREMFAVEGPGGLTDDELCAACEDRYGPTVKTARSRLARSGVLEDSGVRRLSGRGRAQIVWRLA